MTRLTRLAILAAALAAAATATPTFAADDAFGFSPRSGDAGIDAQLGDVNVFARGNLDGYVDAVVISTGAPSDVYCACLIARELGRPCTVVVDAYDRERRGRGNGRGG
jgi:hypothetical protein